MKLSKLLAVVVIAVSAAACGDLEVVNLNDPDRERAISTPTDVEALIAGSFSSWWGSGHYSRIFIPMTTMADAWSSSWGNFGMREMGSEPREGWNNDPSATYASSLFNVWRDSYKALSGVRDGILAVNGGVALGADGADNARGLAFGSFVQGMALARLATTFDKGFIIDENTSLDNPDALPEMAPYTEIAAAAIAKFDAAISGASSSFTIPAAWVGYNSSWSNGRLAEMAHAYKARLMIEVARDEAERAAVNWSGVLAEVAAAGNTDFELLGDDTNWAWSRLHYRAGSHEGWGRSDYQWIGPSDQSGEFQAWASLTNVQLRTPFVIDTDDRRITAGTPTADGLYQKYQAGNNMRAERGTYHWANYVDQRWRHIRLNSGNGIHGAFPAKELDYIKAEALYRTGNMQGAADLINVHRVANGQLPAVTVDGDQSARCVPRHPTTGACQDLWEALKYEKRIELFHYGAGSDFFDDRGWGDLVTNTTIQFPVPGAELDLLLMEIYSFGGAGNPGAAPQNRRDAIDPESIRWKRAALEAYDEVVQAEGKHGQVIN